MNRREFLKIVAAVGAAAKFGLPATAAAHHRLKAGHAYGNAIALTDSSVETIAYAAKRVLIPDIRRSIGGGIVEFRLKIPTDWGRHNALAWYTDDMIQRMPQELASEPVYSPEGGYYFCGRIYVSA